MQERVHELSLIHIFGEIVEQLATYIPQVIQELLPPLMSGVQDLLNTLVGMLPEMISIIGQIIPTIIDLSLIHIFQRYRRGAAAGRSERQQGNSCNYSDTGRVRKLEPVSYTHLDVYKRQRNGNKERENQRTEDKDRKDQT